jgi:hypothetical protein
VLFHAEVPGGEAAALAEVLRSFDDARFDPAVIRAHALTFSADAFRARFAAKVEEALTGVGA